MRIDQKAVMPISARVARGGRALLVALATTLVLAGCGDNPDDLVASARKDMEKKEYRAAILQLKTALQKDANHKDARYALGVALRESGDLASAEKELRRAVELGYDSNAAKRELAHVVYGLGRFEEFIKEYGSLQLAAPEETAELRALAGNVEFARGKVDAAVTAYDEALRLAPGNTTARVGQARVAAARGDLATAETIATEVLGKAPKDREALVVRAALYLAKGDRDNAIATHRKLVEYHPQVVAEHYSLCLLLIESGKTEDAKAAIAAMAKIAANDPRTGHVQAMQAYQAKDYAAAQEFAVKALSRAPEFTPIQLVAGAAAVQLKNFQQAIQYLTSVLKVQKRNLFAHQLLVAAYLGAGEAPRAARALKDAIEVFPNDPKLLLLAGETAVRDRKMSDATKYFELSAEKGDTSGMAQLRLGQSLLAEGKESEALRVLEESAKNSDDKSRSDLVLVMHHLRRGEDDKALKWIENIEKKNPATAVAPTLRGVVQLRKRDLAGARQQFELALQRDGAATTALGYLTRMDLAQNKQADAKRRFEAAVAAHPKNEQLVIDYSRLLRTIGEKLEVVSAPLEKFIKDNPASERARLMLIEGVFISGDRKQAVVMAREAAAALPDNVNIRMALGQALRGAGEHNQAISTYAEVLRAQPRSLPALVATSHAHAALGDYTRALESLDRAIEIAPNGVDIKVLKVRALVQAKQLERALSLARELRQQNPKQSLGYELESSVLVAMDKWADAAEILQTGYREVPSAQMAIRLHAALTQAGQKDRALQVATQWIAAHANDVPVRTYLAERATAAGDHNTAIRYYKEALALAPKSPLLLNNLAWSADQIKDPKAIGYAEEALKLAPNEPAIMDTLGWMLVQKGDTARGVELLEKASKAAPQMLAIRFNYAKALVTVGRKEDARKELDFLKSQGERFKQQAEVDGLYKKL